MYLYDSLQRKKQRFRPLNPHRVGMYVCGPTVYGDIHLGNARPLIIFDVLARVLRQQYPTLVYVRNITDIDDKIIDRAATEGIRTDELVQRTIAGFHADCHALGILPVDHEPRATDYLDEMIKLIEQLIEMNHAYVSGAHVLFSAMSYPDYGALSRRGLDEQIAGARVEVADYKRDARDFVLWKPSDETQPGWSSPWGRGRPGWHIECSAMSKTLLGESFDIHGGGSDLMFPHHENERAQSCCAHPDSQFARTWMHNGMLMVEGEKMSKSLGNFITIKQALMKYPGEVLRFLFLGTHYRKALDFRASRLQLATRTLSGFYQRLSDAALDPAQRDEMPLDADFCAALCDDLNTPLAISRLNYLARHDLRQLRHCGQFLGLFTRKTSEVCAVEQQECPEIAAKIAAREQARRAKDFDAADALRQELLEEGVEIIDTPQGAKWRYMPPSS